MALVPVSQAHDEKAVVSGVRVDSIPPTVQRNLATVLTFADGYGVRVFFDFCRLTIPEAPLAIYPHGVQMIRGNKETFVVDLKAECEDFLEYYVDVSRGNSPSKGCHYLNWSLTELCGRIKTLARREALRFIQYEGDPTIFIQRIGSKTPDGYVTVAYQSFAPKSYNFPQFKQSDKSPNVRIPLAEFCDTCSTVNKTTGAAFVTFSCYPEGVSMSAPGPEGRPCFARWGTCGAEDLFAGQTINSGALNTITPTDLVGGMSKLSGTSTNGLVLVYCEVAKLIRLKLKVNTWAQINVYLHEPLSNSVQPIV